MHKPWWKRLLKAAIIRLNLPVLADMARTRSNAAPIRLAALFCQKVLGWNRDAYWPVHFTSMVRNARRVRIGIDVAPGISPHCYIQGTNGIEIGDYTLIGPGVGIVSANHSFHDLRQHVPSSPIRIGRYCWLGMNAVILPGVELGDHTAVAAGAVVTRSFPEGYCVLGGCPARVIGRIDPRKVIERRNEFEYVGYHRLARRAKEAIYERLGVRALPPSPPREAGDRGAGDREAGDREALDDADAGSVGEPEEHSARDPLPRAACGAVHGIAEAGPARPWLRHPAGAPAGRAPLLPPADGCRRTVR